MADSDAERRQRASARREWPVEKLTLDDGRDDLSATTTATERLSMMWPLAREAWLVSGRSIPSYTRHEMPARLYRPGQTPRDDDAA